MSYTSIKVSKIDNGKVRVTLTDESDGAHQWVDLDGANIEGLIDDLSIARASLIEGVPKTLEPNVRLEKGHLQVDPDWHMHDTIVIDGKKMNGVTSIALRHEGLGWLLFAIPHEKAKAIGEALITKSSAA